MSLPNEPRSPEYVRISTAAAITLGLLPGKMYRTPCSHCLNLLLSYSEGCRANCSYCGLARHREATRYEQRNFIRVDWPLVAFGELIERVAAGADHGQFERMCISMITHPRAKADTFALLSRWREALPALPVSILSNPTSLERPDLERLRDAGAQIFTVALDAATPALFAALRGKGVASPHTWERYWQTLEWAARIFGPERFGAHLICGLGESERELLECCQRIRDLGGHSHLFAFFPERGARMQGHPAVARAPWRRVQLARFLIDHRGVRLCEMDFDEQGRVRGFGLSRAALEAVVETGTPFRTSGCPGGDDPEVSACNRPYGDSSPGDIRSFPFAPQAADLELIRRQLEGEEIATMTEEN